jgi:mono/diheme cytochrome c family protein
MPVTGILCTHINQLKHKQMKRTMYTIVALLSLMAVACNSNQPQVAEKTPPTQEEKVKRGEYLVTAIGCGDCHTPKIMTPQGPVPDMDRYLSGYNAEIPLGEYDTALAASGQWALFKGDLTAAAGPWGVSFAANITSDGTGLGNWSLENFRKAIKEGKYKGIDNSRPLLPPMPWQNFAQLTDEDIEAMFEYLKTVKPVKNLVPQAIPPKA